MFDGEAKRFYRSHVQNRCSSFEDAYLEMQEEFNSLTKQNRIRKYLQTLRLNSVMEKKSCDMPKALEDFRETITKYAPQGPKQHRLEDYKVEYLYDAVIGADWAQAALTQCYASTPPWDFQQLYTALDAAWLQEQRRVDGHLKDKGVPDPSSSISNIMWESEGSYGVPRHEKSTRPRLNFRKSYKPK